MNLKAKSFLLLAVATGAFAAEQSINTADWKTFASKDENFSIRAPKSWGKADPNDAVSKDAMERIKANNPKMAKMFDNQDNRFELYMFDFGGDATKGLSNLNLKVLRDSGLTTAMYPDLADAIIKQANLKNFGHKVIDLPAGKTLSYWGELGVSLGDQQSKDFKVYGYLTVKDNMTYICTMTTTPDQDKTNKPVFDAMAKSIVLK